MVWNRVPYIKQIRLVFKPPKISSYSVLFSEVSDSVFKRIITNWEYKIIPIQDYSQFISPLDTQQIYFYVLIAWPAHELLQH